MRRLVTRRHLDEGGPGIALLILALVCVALLNGCGAATPQENAQILLTASARGVAASDEVIAVEYTAASRVALEEVETMQAFSEAMQPWDRTEAALRGARTSLLTAQAGLSVWEASGDDRKFLRVVKCLAGELATLATAIEATGLDMPPTLRAALELGTVYGQRLCREGQP